MKDTEIFKRVYVKLVMIDSVEKLNEIYDAYFIICDYNTYNYH